MRPFLIPMDALAGLLGAGAGDTRLTPFPADVRVVRVHPANFHDEFVRVDLWSSHFRPRARYDRPECHVVGWSVYEPEGAPVRLTREQFNALPVAVCNGCGTQGRLVRATLTPAGVLAQTVLGCACNPYPEDSSGDGPDRADAGPVA